MSKIEFLLMLISVFVGISYLPIGSDTRTPAARRSIRYQGDAQHLSSDRA